MRSTVFLYLTDKQLLFNKQRWCTKPAINIFILICHGNWPPKGCTCFWVFSSSISVYPSSIMNEASLLTHAFVYEFTTHFWTSEKIDNQYNCFETTKTKKYLANSYHHEFNVKAGKPWYDTIRNTYMFTTKIYSNGLLTNQNVKSNNYTTFFNFKIVIIILTA